MTSWKRGLHSLTQNSIRHLLLLLGLISHSVSASVTIDVLALYTPEAQAIYGNPEARIEALFATANQAHSSSNTGVHLNPVLITNLSQANSEKVHSSALYALTGNASVTQLQKSNAADLIILFTAASSSLCGVAFVASGNSIQGITGIARRSVVGIDCPGRTLAHEIGHSFGLNHSALQGMEGAVVPYGRGYGKHNKFATVMAYEKSFGSASALNRFSQFDINACKSQACGIAPGLAGEADAKRAIEFVALDVAAYTSSSSTPAPPPPAPEPDPLPEPEPEPLPEPGPDPGSSPPLDDEEDPNDISLPQADPLVHYVAFANPASNMQQKTVFRFVNKHTHFVNVEIFGTDDSGAPGPEGSVRFAIPAESSTSLNAQDLEFGNSAKGLQGALGDGQGKWHFRIVSSSVISVLNFIVSPNGNITSLSKTAPQSSVQTSELYLANPASNQTQQGFIRIVNFDNQEGLVTLSAIDDSGEPAPGGNITFTLMANAATQFNSLDYELGNTAKGLNGAFGDGTGKWRIQVSSALKLAAMSLIRSNEGFLTNFSSVSPKDNTGSKRVLFANPASEILQHSFIRIINTSNLPGSVTISGIDDAGYSAPGGELILNLNAYQSVQLNSGDLEQGNTDKNLLGNLGTGSGRWKLSFDSDLEIQVMSLIRMADGMITNLSSAAPKITASQSDILFLNPGDALEQKSILRISNTQDLPGSVSVRAIDDEGAPAPGGVVVFDLMPYSSIELSAKDLEQGNTEKGLYGAWETGQGKWRVSVTSSLKLDVQSLLHTKNGFLTNMSSALQ